MFDPPADLGVTAAIRRLSECFAAHGVDEPDADARVLILASLGLDRAAAIREPETPLGDRASQVGAWAARRLAGEPVSRILGRKEFWGLDFLVTAAVLDPRPETETIVSVALDLLRERRDAPLRILDLGAGSGALLCALASEFPAAFGVGLELSADACAVAMRNATRLGLAGRCRIDWGDWTSFAESPFDLVVSNPPYIPSAEIELLDREVRWFDPRGALDGGADGLRAYREIAGRAQRLVARDFWWSKSASDKASQ